MAYCLGTASSFWLYGADAGSDPGNERFFEIDMFETGVDNPSKLGTNIHYGHNYEPDHYKDPKNFVFQDEDGDNVNLADQFLTYGIELTDTKIKMYLNGVKYAEYSFAPLIPNNPQSYFKQPVPFNIRFGEGSSLVTGNPSDCDDLPKDMLIDYVRLYRKNTVEAIKMSKTSMTLCTQSGGKNFQVDYYPGVTYEWEATPFFNFEVNPNGLTECNCSRWWVTLNPGTPPGDYPIKLNITLPCGGTETKTLNIKVLNQGDPAAPTHIYLLRDVNNILRPAVWIAPGTTAYQWSADMGQTWKTVHNLPQGSYNIWNTHVVLPQSQPFYVNFCVRALNSCGESPSYCEDIYVPSGTCWWCPAGLMPPTDVTLEQIPDSEKYRLKVQVSAPADAYQWSYDEENWNTVTNPAPGSSFYGYNSFGELDSGTPPFLIHVRAKQLDTLSYVYTKLITLPEPGLPMNRPVRPILELALKDKNLPGESLPLIEEATTSIEPQLYIFNVYGQLIKTGSDRRNLVEALQETFPAGLYFLVEQPASADKKAVTKLFITK